MVPTMFRRLLRLPEGVRASYRGEAHKTAWHAAAPCPIELKRAMLDWWGPIINEYYSGSEGGGTIITGPEWLEHPGSVGQHWSGGITHVLDAETFEELPPRKEGLIYFDVLPNYRFAYHNDPGKTEQSYHGDLMTLGDIGFVDEVGYLYLTDRRSDTIVSGGVNIYPAKSRRSCCPTRRSTTSPSSDPDEEFGERVLACVQAPSGVPWDAEVERELDAYCRQNLAGFKCPREYRSVEEMPRIRTGSCTSVGFATPTGRATPPASSDGGRERGEGPYRLGGQGRCGTVWLNRPESRNALNRDVIETLPTVASTALRRDDVQVLVVTGVDPAFCAGLDLRQLGSTGENLGLPENADFPWPWSAQGNQ